MLVSGCATHPDKMSAADVSPIKYQNFDCQQIGAELDRISSKITALYEQLRSDANSDSWEMGVGAVLFFPTLFFLEGGDGAEAVEYRQLKGEYSALESAGIQKKCGLQHEAPEQKIKKLERENQAHGKNKEDKK